MKKREGGREFKVRIDVELPEDAGERIERAIQKAVLTELADTDVADGYSVVMRAPAGEGEPVSVSDTGESPIDPLGGGGVTDGIWITLDPGVLE